MKEFDQRMEESREDWDRRMKKLSEQIWGVAGNYERIIEEYFLNSFENGQPNFFGEKFDQIVKKPKGLNMKIRDEYDILMLNEHALGIVEVEGFKVDNDCLR